MKVNHDSTLRVTTQQLLPNRPLQLIYNFSRNSLSVKLVFIFKINIQRKHMPAKQLLLIRSSKPERLNLALYRI